MPKKTRIGILEEAVSRYRYRISLHPNFSACYHEGSPVYFEVIDADGKLKKVVCSVEMPAPDDIESPPSPEPFRFLKCEQVLSIVEDRQSDLLSEPPSGRVVYLGPEGGETIG